MVLEIKFVGLEPGEKPPAVALFLLDPSGRAVRKLTADKEGKLDIDPALAREALAALGPDVENVAELERNALLQFRPQERLPDWERKKVIEIPRDWWVRWRFFIVCVNGRVRRCLPILLDPITSSTLRFPKPVLVSRDSI